MEKKKPTTYTEAMQEIETILARLNEPNPDIDLLASHSTKAN